MILFDIKADLYGPPSNEREDSSAFQARLAVSAVFDQVEPLQAQLARIASFREPMQRLGELAKVFDELRKFAIQVSDLARVFESMTQLPGPPSSGPEPVCSAGCSRRETQTALRVVRRTFERTRRRARTGGYASRPTRISS